MHNDAPDNDQLQLTSADRRFNFAACLVDAAGWPAGMAFFSLTALLPVYLKHLHAPNVAIGALLAMINLLIFLPGFAVVPYLRRLERARTYLLVVALLERFSLLPLVPLTLLWGTSHPGWLLRAVFCCFAMHGLMMGLNQPAYWIVIGKCVPAVWRGRLFGFGGTVAGVLCFAVDAILRHVLAGPNGGFPRGYAEAFIIGFVVLVVSVLPLGIVREPRHTVVPDEHKPGRFRQDASRVWRTQPHFRRFLYSQMAFVLVAVAGPYYVLAAQYNLHAPPSALAAFVAVTVFAGSFGSLAWGAWADRGGNKIVLICASVCMLLAAVAALVAGTYWFMVCAGGLAALAVAGVGLAGNNLVMEYAPQSQDIPLYISLFNGATALPRAAACLVGGLIADHAGGYHAAFWVSAVLAAASAAMVFGVVEPRHHTGMAAGNRTAETTIP